MAIAATKAVKARVEAACGRLHRVTNRNLPFGANEMDAGTQDVALRQPVRTAGRSGKVCLLDDSVR